MQNCACVSHRRTCLDLFGMITLNKGANVCWCLISSKAQACGYALQILWYIPKNRPELTIEEVPLCFHCTEDLGGVEFSP